MQKYALWKLKFNNNKHVQGHNQLQFECKLNQSLFQPVILKEPHDYNYTNYASISTFWHPIQKQNTQQLIVPENEGKAIC